ncbi:tauropine dehydrogenase-like [Patiria miniata]|uniref:Opine dehydrogenase domain-containing protein n=1 Tax=Patiria miniata TaxID=46514 RepID=A0A914BIG0_PATMI|nr:tauropine dehydrogenase-like [Patiria miniata]XP_038075226.1 tauropine dehydrogenase-like [Patiria miniata]
MPLKVLILGGGNGAHVHAGIAASNPENEVRVMTLFQDEAERWSKALESSDLVLDYTDKDGKEKQFVSKPGLITKDPKLAVPGSDIIVFVVPAFAHAQYWEALKPHMEPGMVVIGMPGAAGWEFQAYDILGDKAKGITFFNFNTLPWNCRITEFGKRVGIVGFKDYFVGAIRKGSVEPKVDPLKAIQQSLGPRPVCTAYGDLLGMTLTYTNAFIHPSIMYGRWHDWDGKPVSESPLFYQGLDQASADLLSGVSSEIVAIAKTISAKKAGIDLSNAKHISDIMLEFYPEDIKDKSSFLRMMQSNKAFEGLRHPVINNEGGGVSPDFKARYIWEDVPFGLVVQRGIAEIVGVPTPNIDKIITWGQGLMGKEFLVDGKIKGKDIGMTRAPQRYGFTTLDAVLGAA